MANHSAKMASLVTVPTHQQHSSSYINVLVFLPRPSREQQQQRLTRVRHEKDVATEKGGRELCQRPWRGFVSQKLGHSIDR